MRLSSFNFELPPSKIAQRPRYPRGSSLLLRVKESGFVDLKFSDIDSALGKGDVLVFNNTRVLKARLFGRCDNRTIELLMHQKMSNGLWHALAKPSKALYPAAKIIISDSFICTVVEKLLDGSVTLDVSSDDNGDFHSIEKYGHIPLPPYMKRKDDQKDQIDYQTVFAEEYGSVASPTAGLHFNLCMLEGLKSRGVQIEFLTLHVGLGTFTPIKTQDVKDHVMHEEWVRLDQDTTSRLNQAKREGRKIIAVGTTSLRVLESALDSSGMFQPMSGATNIFITPGYKFRSVNMLLTNFHLPLSTLFILVCAFSGEKLMKKAYQHAIEGPYQFYSYGDACLIDLVEAS
jgi:S-adenosylmethionine:tRNA ribosyltransferase-isomerase